MPAQSNSARDQEIFPVFICRSDFNAGRQKIDVKISKSRIWFGNALRTTRCTFAFAEGGWDPERFGDDAKTNRRRRKMMFRERRSATFPRVAAAP
jgi:hypothetical protein